MSFWVRRTGSVFLDIVMIWISIGISYGLLYYTGGAASDQWRQAAVFGIFSTLTGASCLVLFRLYLRIWRYAGLRDAFTLFFASGTAHVLAYAAVWSVTGNPIPLSVAIISFQSILLFQGGVRLLWKAFHAGTARNSREPASRVLIFGAGRTGRNIAVDLKYEKDSQLVPVAFLDDDRSKHGMRICGLPVLGGRDKIGWAVERYVVDDIVIAMQTVSRKSLSEIIQICKSTRAKVKIVPNLNELITGKISVSEMRNVEPEDLLGREPNRINLETVSGFIQGKTVLITGAGGSIGSELCRQIATLAPARLVLFGRGEHSIVEIHKELLLRFPDLLLYPVIGDIQDRSRVEQSFEQYRPDLVFHAAAYKHVPLMQFHPGESIKNNVFGTLVVAETSAKFAVDKFILISSDKAVNPTSVMGATKRLAEMVALGLNRPNGTKFAAVRFGNVLGSRGSVIPEFQKQIAKGGPVTVTHPDMIRYFMTIQEAAQLVVQAGVFAAGGEVFVLDMGKPVKILDLARDLIRLSGYEPDKDISIAFTGIRPGEKLFEELLTEEEGLGTTLHDRIFISRAACAGIPDLQLPLRNLEKVIHKDEDAILQMLQRIIPGYQYVS